LKKDKIKLPLVLTIFNFLFIFLVLAYYSEDAAFGFFRNDIVISWVTVSDFLTYDDILSGFSIKYPPDWQLEQGIDRALRFKAPRDGTSSDSSPAGLAITFKEVPANVSLSTITQTQLGTLKNLYPDFKLLESGETSFGGRPAYRIVFTATDPDQLFKKAMQIWFKESTKAYLITYKADVDTFSNYLSTVEQMLNSFYIAGNSQSSS
jgi:eukaryotic-like serine/threonine-protein kinase